MGRADGPGRLAPAAQEALGLGGQVGDDLGGGEDPVGGADALAGVVDHGRDLAGGVAVGAGDAEAGDREGGRAHAGLADDLALERLGGGQGGFGLGLALGVLYVPCAGPVLAAIVVAGGRAGFSATLFYTTIYAVTLVGAFGVVALVRRQTGGDDFQNLAGLWSRSPFLAGCMSIFILSLAGIPPLAGFFGKFYLFSVTLGAGGNHGLLWLVALALFGSLISLYYYLIVLKVIFVDEAATQTSVVKVDLLSRISLTLLALLVLVLGITPEPLAARIIASLP